MDIVSGDVTIRTGSQDYIKWQLLLEDSVTPISLAGADDVIIRFKNKTDDTIVEFKVTDNPQKFFITDAANGKIELRPAVGDFTTIASYKFHIIPVDSVGNHPIPEGRDYTLQVIDSYAPAV